VIFYNFNMMSPTVRFVLYLILMGNPSNNEI